MKQVQFALLILVVAMPILPTSAFTENSVDKALLPAPALLEKHFEKCINNNLCPTQEKFLLIKEMTDGMSAALQHIQKTCLSMNYADCVSPQMSDVIQWHQMDNHMRVLMQMLEQQYTVTTLSKKPNLIEPSAGPKPNPYTDPDQEQLDKNKQDWWYDWVPPDEANPYHNW